MQDHNEGHTKTTEDPCTDCIHREVIVSAYVRVKVMSHDIL